jgi:hypothetical protein
MSPQNGRVSEFHPSIQAQMKSFFFSRLKSPLNPLRLLLLLFSSGSLASIPNSSTPYAVSSSTKLRTTLGLIGPSGGNGFALFLASSKLIFLARAENEIGVPSKVPSCLITLPGIGLEISLMLDLERVCLSVRGGGLRGEDRPKPVSVKGFGARSA